MGWAGAALLSHTRALGSGTMREIKVTGSVLCTWPPASPAHGSALCLLRTGTRSADPKRVAVSPAPLTLSPGSTWLSRLALP